MQAAAVGDGRAVVIFHLGGHAFAFESQMVAEVVPNAWLARPPALPSMVAGLLDLGGVAVTVLRGDHALDLPEQTFGLAASILIMRQTEDAARGLSDRVVGVLVGRVDGVRDLASCQILPLSEELSFRSLVLAQLQVGGDVVHLLDWKRVLDAEEVLRLSDFHDRALRRSDLWDQ